MRRVLKLAVVSLISATAWPASTPDVIGTWEGESKCVVADSPCHDEHVIYRIAVDKNDKTKLAIDADKIVNGTPVFMGTVVCQYSPSQSVLSCTANTPKQDEWEFQISGENMTGTLTIGAEKMLFRRVSLHRVHAKGN